MKRRSKRTANRSEPIKGRRRKAPQPKRRNAPKTLAPSNLSNAGKTAVARLTLERNEALRQLKAALRQSLQQQTAASEVLQVISSFPGDLQPVFATIVENAVRICDAKFGSLYLREEGGIRLVAAYDMPVEFSNAHGSSVINAAPGGVVEGAMTTKRPIQINDLTATKAYTERHPAMVDAVELGGIRTAVAAPMLKREEPIGVIQSIAQKSFPSAISRSGYSRTSPPKRSLPSRTRGCSMNCASEQLTSPNALPTSRER